MFLLGVVLAVVAFACGSVEGGVVEPRPGEAPKVVTVTLGKPEPLPSGLYGLNTDLLTAVAFHGLNFGSTEIERAWVSARPGSMRFPGGSIANHYLWQNDSFSDPIDDKTEWAGRLIRAFRQIGKPYDLPGFASASRKHGTETVWVLNVFEETPESVVRLIAEWDRLGLKVEAVEMGNEPYWDGRSLNDVVAYIRYCRPLAEAMKRERPSLRLGACFAPLGNPAHYEATWNAVLARETWFDAAVVHDYFGGQGFALEPGAALPVEAMLHPEEMVRAQARAMNLLLPGRDVWLTEWNVGMQGLEKWKNTGAELLFISGVMSELLTHRSTFSRAVFHSFYDPRFGLFYYDEQQKQVRTHASAELFRLFGVILGTPGVLRPAGFSPPADSVYGFAVEQEGDTLLMVVNRGAEPVDLRLPVSATTPQVGVGIDCRPGEPLKQSAVLLRPLAVEVNGGVARVTVPGYSVNVVGAARRLESLPR